MTDLALFDVDEPEWVPVAKNFGMDLAEVIQETRCRDCGRKGGGGGHCCGGADARGIWELCDDCASLDGCLARESVHTPGRHCSRWGLTHTPAEHDVLIAAQAKRRAAYLRKVVTA